MDFIEKISKLNSKGYYLSILYPEFNEDNTKLFTGTVARINRRTGEEIHVGTFESFNWPSILNKAIPTIAEHYINSTKKVTLKETKVEN